MKKIIIPITLLFSLLFLGAKSQQRRGDKVESIKIAFLSERLNLDPKSAERFWPIYNQYVEEMHNVLLERRNANKNDTRTADEILDQEQKAIDLKRKYSAQFLKVISNEQLNQLFRSEKDFNQMLIRRMNQKEERRENNSTQQPTYRPSRTERPQETRQAPQPVQDNRTRMQQTPQRTETPVQRRR